VTGSVQERYLYAAYGLTTVLTPTFIVRGSSSFDSETLFAAYRWDADTGLYLPRFRRFHGALGRWTIVDPISTNENLYSYCNSNPTNIVDPFGLYPVAVCCAFENNESIWDETNWCDSGTTLASCCASRALGWGWGSPWTVLAARYGECGSDCKWYIQQSGVGERAAGGRCKQFLANEVGGHWNLVSTCYGEVWQGLNGPVTTQPWSMDPRLPFNVGVFGYLKCRKRRDIFGVLEWGSAGIKGKFCFEASDNDIADCVRHKPKYQGPWSLANNCQTDVKQVVEDCCLECERSEGELLLHPYCCL
jgi:RHS repeat-associated protein